MIKRIAVTLLTVGLVIFTLSTLQRVAQLNPLLFFPNLFRFWIAALVLGIIQSFEERAAPQLSIRLMHSATAAGVLFLAVPNVLWMWALRQLPLHFVALTMAVVPLWINVLLNLKDRRFLIGGLTSLLGLLIASIGFDQSQNHWALVGACLIAALSSTFAGLMSRHLFWIHATVNLNLWSMVFASAILIPAALINKEIGLLRGWSIEYWTQLGLLAVVCTAIGAYFYRRISFHLSPATTAIILIAAPVYAIFTGLVVQTLIPNVALVAGFLLVVVPLVWLCLKSQPMHWLYQYLANSRRIGDRIDVNLSGYVKTAKAQGTIRITSISIGGLGFESEIYCPVSEQILVTLPMGKNFTTVSFDTVSAYTAKLVPGGTTWKGGLAFQKLNLATTQILAEFVARFGEIEPSEEPAIEITREWKFK